MTRWEAFGFISNALQSILRREALSIDADRISWDVVLQLASEHVVTPTLAWALKDAPGIPEEVRDYLNITLDLNHRRNESTVDCLEAALAALNSVGCEPLLLKGGAAILEDGLYPDLSVRYLVDLDILVPEPRLSDASVALSKIDFHVMPEEDRRWVRVNVKHPHHLPALVHRSTGVLIELHRTVSLAKFEPILPTVTALQRRVERNLRDLDFFVLCPSDRIIHNIVHSQLFHRHYEQGSVELRQLFELALLTIKFGDEIDWKEVENRFRMTGHLEILQSHSALLHAVFSVHLKIGGQDNPNFLLRLQSKIESPATPS
jgi:hypothetical protein